MGKRTAYPYGNDVDNRALADVCERLEGLGLTQQDIASRLGISPGQLSRVRRGERKAAPKHVRTLRRAVKSLSTERAAEEKRFRTERSTPAPFRIDNATLSRLSPTEATAAFRAPFWTRTAEKALATTQVSISSCTNTADGGVDAAIIDSALLEGLRDDLLDSGTRFQLKQAIFGLGSRQN